LRGKRCRLFSTEISPDSTRSYAAPHAVPADALIASGWSEVPAGTNHAPRGSYRLNGASPIQIDLESELDTLIDSASLTAVLAALVQVCPAPAEQEVTWNVAAGRLERCAASIERLGL
jgi:hypothetical protein